MAEEQYPGLVGPSEMSRWSIMDLGRANLFDHPCIRLLCDDRVRQDPKEAVGAEPRKAQGQTGSDRTRSF